MANVVTEPTALLEQKAAARTKDAVKIYGRGQTEVRALDGVPVAARGGVLRLSAGAGPA